MAVREGDPLSTGHGCDSVTTLLTSPNKTTRANSIFCAVVGTITVTHLVPPNVPPCGSHAAFLNAGSPNVSIGGIPWGRVGDSADAGAMISGSVNVLVNGR